MQSLNIYLTFNGNAEAAMNFYQEALGGKLELHRFQDMPDSQKLAAADQQKLMHASLTLDNGLLLMAADNVEGLSGCGGEAYKVGNNFSISISPTSKEEADQLFNTLARDGVVIMPLQQTFWNAYFGMLIDKFAIKWMINFEMSPG